MDKLEKILKEYVKNARIEYSVKETLEDIKELNDNDFKQIKKENIEDKTEEFKELRFAIRNNINQMFLIQDARENEYLTSDDIKQIAEEIAKEYLK